MTVKSSSHSPVYETKFEDNSPTKLSRAIILFLSKDYSQSPWKNFSQFQLPVVDIVYR